MNIQETISLYNGVVITKAQIYAIIRLWAREVDKYSIPTNIVAEKDGYKMGMWDYMINGQSNFSYELDNKRNWRGFANSQSTSGSGGSHPIINGYTTVYEKVEVE